MHSLILLKLGGDVLTPFHCLCFLVELFSWRMFFVALFCIDSKHKNVDGSSSNDALRNDLYLYFSCYSGFSLWSENCLFAEKRQRML